MHRLAICATVRDEGRDLREWVVFHRLMGVEHFWLYDNFSKDHPEQVLAQEIAQGWVEIQSWDVPFHEGGQRGAYEHCLNTHGHETAWLAFIDVDEFLFSPGGAPLPHALERFSQAPGVAVNWLTFGSSGREQREGLLTIEAFTRRAPTQWVRNQRVKSVVRPDRTAQVLSVHVCAYRDDQCAVNGSGVPVKALKVGRSRRRWRRWLSRLFPRGPFDRFAFWEVSPRGVFPDALVIHHYATRSRSEFIAKRKRFGSPRPGVKGLEHRKDEYYFRWHDRNDLEDLTLARMAPRVRQALGEGPPDLTQPGRAG